MRCEGGVAPGFSRSPCCRAFFGLWAVIFGEPADLLEAARRRNLSANSLAAYERTWTRFLAWAAASNFDLASFRRIHSSPTGAPGSR
jgi:hypothetical protein